MIEQWKASQSLYKKYGGRVVFQQTGPEPLDAYHEYLVTGWMLQVAAAPGFSAEIPGGVPLRFSRPAAPQGALRSLSECLLGLGAARSD